MFLKYLKLSVTYVAILAAGLAIGWGAPRAYQWLKPAYSEGDYSAYYAGTATNIAVYGTPTCQYCAKTRAFLSKHHIQFADFDVTKDDKARRDYASLDSKTVPVILVGRRRINGFNEAALKDALEAAGYPISK